MKKYFIFLGARPNFMKASSLCQQFEADDIAYEVFHSGQHYDRNLSGVFRQQFHFNKIIDLECRLSDNQIENIQRIMFTTRNILRENLSKVRCVIVFGDVLTTLAVALAAKELELPLAHVEAGLRCFDICVPEELIRITVDHISDYLFCPSGEAVDNLNKEGRLDNIFMVGNIMIDCLINNSNIIYNCDYELPDKPYLVCTFHRQENVDNESNLKAIYHQLYLLSEQYKVIFPVHPKTKKRILEYQLDGLCDNIQLIEPLGYFEFIKLVKGSKGVITDSGGIQEETTFLNVPCFTVRKNTERPITITQGTNRLLNIDQIFNTVSTALKLESKTVIPYMWDGKTSGRIAEKLYQIT